MAFELSYGGVSLCIPTTEAMDWLAHSIPTEDTRIANPERSWPGPNLIAAAYPFRFPARPTIRWNDFHYPTHMSRWGEFHAMVAEDQYQQLLQLSGPQEFVMSQDSGTVVTEMLALPIRPLAKFSSNPGLYHLTLVDRRWSFQNYNTGAVVIDNTTTWDSLINFLASQLGIALSFSPVGSVYGQPHPKSCLALSYENAALALDACLWNTGRVAVRNLDGTYAALTTAESRAMVSIPAEVLAGGDYTTLGAFSVPPGAVRVTFPCQILSSGEYVDGSSCDLPYARTAGKLHSEVVTLSEAGFDGVGDGEKLFHDTAPAYLTLASDTSVLNASQLHSLAVQVAQDYYGADRPDGLDIVLPSIVLVAQEGLHDCLWSWSQERCATRLSRKPHNFGVEELSHWFPASGAWPADVCGPPFTPLVKITGISQTGNYYPGLLQYWDDASQSFQDLNDTPVWVLLVNPTNTSGASFNIPPPTPSYGDVYISIFQGQKAADGKSVYVATVAASFHAKITGQNAITGACGWIEQNAVGGGAFVDKLGGRSGSLAYESNGTRGIPTNLIVWLRPVAYTSPAEYRFEYCCKGSGSSSSSGPPASSSSASPGSSMPSATPSSAPTCIKVVTSVTCDPYLGLQVEYGWLNVPAGATLSDTPC